MPVITKDEKAKKLVQKWNSKTAHINALTFYNTINNTYLKLTKKTVTTRIKITQ